MHKTPTKKQNALFKEIDKNFISYKGKLQMITDRVQKGKLGVWCDAIVNEQV